MIGPSVLAIRIGAVLALLLAMALAMWPGLAISRPGSDALQDPYYIFAAVRLNTQSAVVVIANAAMLLLAASRARQTVLAIWAWWIVLAGAAILLGTIFARGLDFPLANAGRFPDYAHTVTLGMQIRQYAPFCAVLCLASGWLLWVASLFLPTRKTGG